MLQAHSFLWNYLWVAPNLLLLLLVGLLWRRGISQHIPSFIAFAILNSVAGLATYTADITPSVSAMNFWRVNWGGLLIESILKFIVIGEVFSRLLKPYPSVSRVGRIMISFFGAALVLVAALVAGFSHIDSDTWTIWGFHILSQTVFLVELGLVLTVFSFAAYFRLLWDRISFGILLGFGVSSSEYVAAWAILTNGNLSAHGRALLDLCNMATFHVCVLIWFYYLLVPVRQAGPPPSPPTLPESNLDVWNRELERLLQQ